MAVFTARNLALRIGAEVVGHPELPLSGVAPLDEAGPEHLSFLANPRYASRLAASRAGAVIVSDAGLAPDRVQLVAADPYLALRGALLAFHRLFPEVRPGISPHAHVEVGASVDATAEIQAGAVVAAGAEIGPGVCIGAGGIVGRDCVVGEDSYLYPRVTLYPKVRLGRRVIVHAGAVLGADGFGFAQSPQGALKIPQVGGVQIGDDVEIGANTTIDRATLGNTKIGRGTKIDNLVMIAHNVEIGAHCLIVSQVGIAGSTKVGDGVIIAGQAGLVGHIEIGRDVKIGAQSGVANDLEPGKSYLGSPARELGQQKRILAYLARLPDWARRLKALEDAVAGGRPE
jgi:UDP-3-O-[3-hydroxymyristoyl] glucosamine N-acyltransferase